MTKHLTTLTDEQRAAMDGHADEWIRHGWSTEPANWALAGDAVRRCYEFAGLPWHDNVVRVSSPLALAVAGPAAAYEIALRRRLAGGAVGDAVDDAVHDAVDDAVHDAVDGAVHDAVRGAVGDAVGDAVHDAVGGADAKAIYIGALRTIRQLYYYRLWGNLWPYWQARNSFFRDHCQLELDGDMWDRSRAYEDTAKAAGWWWPHKEFTMICDRPAVLHVEQVGPRGWRSHRLHCETGPAIAWRDGYALHYWHGIRVPADLIEQGWDTERILREPNAEIRRCAIERMGWDRFVVDARLTQVGETVPDPGNPGNLLALFDVPEQIYNEPIRVLLCTNGTVERDGTRRRFGLTVPASIDAPVAAAAWGYGLNPSQYATAQRRA